MKNLLLVLASALIIPSSVSAGRLDISTRPIRIGAVDIKPGIEEMKRDAQVALDSYLSLRNTLNVMGITNLRVFDIYDQAEIHFANAGRFYASALYSGMDSGYSAAELSGSVALDYIKKALGAECAYRANPLEQTIKTDNIVISCGSCERSPFMNPADRID